MSQVYGPMALDLYIEGPDMRRQLLPARMLVRPRPSKTSSNEAVRGIHEGQVRFRSLVAKPPAFAGGNSQHR